MIDHRLKQLFLAALGLHAATPTARAEVAAYRFQRFRPQPARAGKTGIRPPVAANDNAATPAHSRHPNEPA